MMNMTNILVPIDFSKFDEPVLDMATTLARSSGAKLIIIHVHESPMAYGGRMYHGELNPSEVKLRQMLREVKPPDTSIAFEHHLIKGEGVSTSAQTDVARAIAEYADKQGVDLIVMSTHGRTGLSRMLMGSVTEKVVRRADRPVLTVKMPKHGA